MSWLVGQLIYELAREKLKQAHILITPTGESAAAQLDVSKFSGCVMDFSKITDVSLFCPACICVAESRRKSNVVE